MRRYSIHPKVLAMSDEERKAWADRTGRGDLLKIIPKKKKSKKEEGGD